METDARLWKGAWTEAWRGSASQSCAVKATAHSRLAALMSAALPLMGLLRTRAKRVGCAPAPHPQSSLGINDTTIAKQRWQSAGDLSRCGTASRISAPDGINGGDRLEANLRQPFSVRGWYVLEHILPSQPSDWELQECCQWRSKKGPPRRCKKGPLGGCGLVPVVHGRAPRATRRALNRLTRRRAREGPVGPRGQAWAGWSVQLAVGV